MTHSVVVGGAGFVGSWVVEELLKDPESRVTIIDNLMSSEKWNISKNPRVTFIEGSAADFATFEKIEAPIDTLYHLACFHGNQSSIARPLDDLENGLKTTLVTLEWIKNNSRTTRVLYAGAGCAVAEKTWESPNPIEEIDYTSIKHDSPYSISKITGEMYCLFYALHHKLDVVRVRFQNVYGPREILGAGKWRGTENTIWRNVIPTFVWKALHDQPLTIYGDGSRDFIYVQDLTHGIMQATKKGESGEVYNLASGTETKIEALALKIKNITDSRSEILIKHRRNWDNSGRRLGSTSKSKKLIDFSAEINLETGLHRTVDWTKNNGELIRTSILKHDLKL
jgi:nucleoside-diphosphate-sugar epimerase